MNKSKQALLYSNKTQKISYKLRSQHLILRNKLKLQVISVAKNKGYTQKELSLVLGISQPRVSNLLGDGDHSFSIDALTNFLGRLGIRVEFNCYLNKTTKRRSTASL